MIVLLHSSKPIGRYTTDNGLRLYNINESQILIYFGRYGSAGPGPLALIASTILKILVYPEMQHTTPRILQTLRYGYCSHSERLSSDGRRAKYRSEFVRSQSGLSGDEKCQEDGRRRHEGETLRIDLDYTTNTSKTSTSYNDPDGGVC